MKPNDKETTPKRRHQNKRKYIPIVVAVAVCVPVVTIIGGLALMLKCVDEIDRTGGG